MIRYITDLNCIRFIVDIVGCLRFNLTNLEWILHYLFDRKIRFRYISNIFPNNCYMMLLEVNHLGSTGFSVFLMDFVSVFIS